MAGVVGTQQGSSKFSALPGTFTHQSGGTTTTTTDPTTGAVTTTTSGVGAILDVVGSVGGAGSPFATIITQIVNSRFGSLDAVLSALDEQNVIRQLAEPNLVALSGETASFLAGGEYPVPVVSPGNVGLATVTIQYKEFGVKLNFTPTVLARGVISLKLAPEVSALSFINGVSISGTTVPRLIVRKAQTTVELRDGQSFAIAGMLQANSTRILDQLPWLGTVPIIGALFRSSQFQQNENGTDRLRDTLSDQARSARPTAQDTARHVARRERSRLLLERPMCWGIDEIAGRRVITQTAISLWHGRDGGCHGDGCHG